AHRPSSPAGAAGETLKLERPHCGPGQVQRLVRPDYTSTPRRLEATAAYPLLGSLEPLDLATIVQQGKALAFDNDLCFFGVRPGEFGLGLLVHSQRVNQHVQTRGAEELAAGDFFLDVLVVEPAVLARVGELPTLPRCLVNQKVLRLEGAIRLELQPGIL